MNTEGTNPIIKVEMLPEYDFSKVSFDVICQMLIDFSDFENKRFSTRKITEAFIALRTIHTDFTFSSPEDILKKYQEIIQ